MPMSMSRTMPMRSQRVWVMLCAGAAWSAVACHESPNDPVADTRDLVGVRLGVSLTSQFVRDDGVVVSWGYSEEGSRGFPIPKFDPLNPVPIPGPSEVDLGGEPVLAVAAGRGHACAVFEDGRLKCWGWNMYGQLGLGDTENRGDDPGEMGDSLPYVDLGAGRRAAAVTVMPGSTCALLDGGAVKCWGANTSGQLGLGDTEQRGDEPGEMGDALPEVQLGLGRTAQEIDAGGAFACALLDDANVKCWGANDPVAFQLGLSSDARGDEPGEMGDAMPNIDLGRGVRVATVSCGDRHSCVLTDVGAVKCWGLGAEGWCLPNVPPFESGPCFDSPNRAGRLGYGDAYSRPPHYVFPFPEGIGMGDLLADVDLGEGVKALAVEAGIEHTCALTTDHRVKCWGSASEHRLGSSVSQDVGDDPGEMGDALPYVDLGKGREVRALSSRYSYTCVLLDDGAVKCWGGDYPKEMGDALPAIDIPQ
jgi:alpha-tubulin suppressor-like RCC1 family protein